MTAYVPLTPVDIERKARQLLNDLAKAVRMLAEVRDSEVGFKHLWERAFRQAILSDACPKVERGGVTVAERDAWVDRACQDEREAYDLAQVARQAAEDHARTLRDQSMLVMSLGKQVDTAYRMVGVAES